MHKKRPQCLGVLGAKGTAAMLVSAAPKLLPPDAVDKRGARGEIFSRRSRLVHSNARRKRHIFVGVVLCCV